MKLEVNMWLQDTFEQVLRDVLEKRHGIGDGPMRHDQVVLDREFGFGWIHYRVEFRFDAYSDRQKPPEHHSIHFSEALRLVMAYEPEGVEE